MRKRRTDMITLGFIQMVTYCLKTCLAWLGTLVVFQSIDYELFKALSEGVLSATAQWLGFLYLVFIVAKKGVDLWEHWRKALYRIKEERERHKQSKIDTDKKLKDLKE